MGRRAIPVGYGLDEANVYAADLGAPSLPVANRFVTSVRMKVGAYTVANASPADGQARNVTVTVAQAGGVNDTMGTVTITGTDHNGAVISETLTPVVASTVAGLKAFKTVTNVVGAGWVLQGGGVPAQDEDLITVGFGNLIGLPYAIRRKPVVGASGIWLTYLGTAVVAATLAFDAADLSKCTVDASAATYDGTKRLVTLVLR